MSPHIIVAVGGTGQLVLQQYLQLHLTGQLLVPFRAVVIDTDRPNRPLSILSRFLDLLRPFDDAVRQENVPWPRVEFLRPESSGHDEVATALTAQHHIDLPATHPVRALFTDEALQQQVRDGWFARPALSAALASNYLESDALRLTGKARVVVVGSLIGGTGGGLLVPLIAHLGEEAHRHGSDVRAVLFGEWFTSTSTVSSDRARLVSNQILGLTALREVGHLMHSFALVGGHPDETTRERNPSEEKERVSLWPTSSTHPIWLGALYIHHLLVSTVQSRPSRFEARQVERTVAQRQVALSEARSIVEVKLKRAGALCKRDVILRMRNDPWAQRVWGQGLCQLVSALWTGSARASPGTTVTRHTFMSELQRALGSLWESPSDGAINAFPSLGGSAAPLVDIRGAIRWPYVQHDALDRSSFADTTEAARRGAAMILWSALY